MMKRLISSVLAVGILMVFGACASIVSTSHRPINLRSNPDEAQVTVWNDEGTVVFKGVTPTIVTLETGTAYFHGHKYVLLFTKEGFENRNVKIESAVNPWYLGNVVLGGLIGMLIVDPLTGSMWTLSPRDVNLDFTKAVPIEPPPKEPEQPTGTGWGGKN